MASGVGTATLDFGAWPGLNEASVAVVGQATISATSAVEAWLMSEASGGHSALDASWVALFLAITAPAPTAGVGFTITARSVYSWTGTFAVRWVWSD